VYAEGRRSSHLKCALVNKPFHALGTITLNLLCREMGDEKVAYYSSIVQFDALCAALSTSDQYACEVALLHTLTDIRPDVIAHMSLTTELTDMYRGARKSAIMIHDGMLYLLIEAAKAHTLSRTQLSVAYIA